MVKSILRHGLIAGLIVGIPLFTISLFLHGQSTPPWGAVVGYLTMLIAFSLIFIAIKQQRDQSLDGRIHFWHSMLIGISITLMATIFYVLAWEMALFVTKSDFAGDYAKSFLADQKAKGISGQALAKLEAEMETFRQQYANPLFRMLMTSVEIIPVGVIVSLVSAGLFSNPKFMKA